MKSRTILGLICIVMAALLTFVIAPFINNTINSNNVEVIFVKKNITQGCKISDNEIEIKKVSISNLTNNIIKSKEDVIGKYATSDIKAGVFLVKDNISEQGTNISDIISSLPEGKLAISIKIKTFAAGFSGKLSNGDIVSIIVNDGNTSSIPDKLKYVKVITTTTDKGIDKDELKKEDDGTYELPETVTFLVNEEQAKLLTQYQYSCDIHIAFVAKGANADKYIQ